MIEVKLTFPSVEVYHAFSDILEAFNRLKAQRDELNNRLLLCEEEIRRRDINEKKDIKQDELVKLYELLHEIPTINWDKMLKKLKEALK